jgi:hypothetical protein
MFWARTTGSRWRCWCERLADDEETLTGTILVGLDPKFSPDGHYRSGKYV